MDYKIPLFVAFSCFLSLHFLILCLSRNRKPSKLPPGPNPWSIIGNIFQLSNNPHHSLTNLSKIYGPLMTLKLGSITTIVVSSVDITKQVFQLHDKSFSSRRVPEAAKALDHHSYSMAWLPASHQWRNLRKIATIQLFTKQRLDATQKLRHTKVNELLGYVKECCEMNQPVDVGRAAFTTTLNLLSNTFFSVDLVSYGSSSSQEFLDLARGIMELLGRPNMADYFPALRWFDPFGVRRDSEGYYRKMFGVFDDIIKKRLTDESSSKLSSKDDVLGALLKIIEEDGSDFSLLDIKHLFLDLIAAGTDTTSSTLEWAMTELLRNPTKLAKAQAEIHEILGKDEGLVQESDVERLPYLQAIVKETFRIHPAGPLLVPHKSETEVSLCGYVVPKNTQLLVNVWAMNRDPRNWPNPETFHPERFLGSEIDFRGQDFELIPFGAGRRICPGLPLAHRMLHLMLANLVHSFEWRLEKGMREKDVDMNEKFGLSLHKAKPLLAVPLAK